MRSKKLSRIQLSAIAQIAHKAYTRLVNCGQAGGGYKAEQEWRHAEQSDVLGGGRSSLTSATQEDYVPLYNHFAQIAGAVEKEDSTWSDRDKAMKLLQDTMQQHELDVDWLYLLAIGKHPRKLMGYTCNNLMEAIRVKLTALEIMQLMYTINARGRMKNRKIGDAFDL